MVRRTKEDALATRHRLIDAAELLFQSQGVSQTSLQQIAEHAGATRGAVYWHFKDKADLFNAMMERVTLPLEAAAAVADGAASAPDGIDNLREVTRLHICLDALEPRTSEAIRSAYFNGFSYAELAARSAVPLGTMKSWIRRGFDSLKKCLSDGE